MTDRKWGAFVRVRVPSYYVQMVPILQYHSGKTKMLPLDNRTDYPEKTGLRLQKPLNVLARPPRRRDIGALP